MKFMRGFIATVLLATLVACGPALQRLSVSVGQAGVAMADSIALISKAGADLQKAGALPTATALRLQEQLLVANEQLKPLPDILRALDAAQKAGNVQATDVDKAVAILRSLNGSVSTLLVGVPLSEQTKQIVSLVQGAATAVATVLSEVSRLRPAPAPQAWAPVAMTLA